MFVHGENRATAKQISDNKFMLAKRRIDKVVKRPFCFRIGRSSGGDLGHKRQERSGNSRVVCVVMFYFPLSLIDDHTLGYCVFQVQASSMCNHRPYISGIYYLHTMNTNYIDYFVNTLVATYFLLWIDSIATL